MTAVQAALLYEKAETRFVARNPQSRAIYERATQSLPGGNTRSVLYYDPFPVSVVRANGACLHDADGHDYVNFLGEYTAGLYGHSEPVIIDAITQAAKRGLNFGSHHEDEVKLAALVQDRFPSMELLRFTNSGTEATLMALAVAKVHTSRKKILVFAGGYHGGAFTFKGGHDSPVNAPHQYLIARYNDLSSVQKLLQDPDNAHQVAAILVEPMIGSGGAIPARPGFLEGLRRLANSAGALLIFDEVMTSRMHNGGGIQSQLAESDRPDITTVGKYIGGGMSFGAFGGRREIMALYDPRRKDALAHAGTFNNNVLTMAAGRAGLEQVFTPIRAQALHTSGESLRRRLQDASLGSLMKVTGYGSIMVFHFTKKSVDDIRSPLDLDGEYHSLNDLLHLFLLERGYYIARRGFIALSLALTDQHLDGFVGAVKDFLQEHQEILRVSGSKAKL